MSACKFVQRFFNCTCFELGMHAPWGFWLIEIGVSFAWRTKDAPNRISLCVKGEKRCRSFENKATIVCLIDVNKDRKVLSFRRKVEKILRKRM